MSLSIDITPIPKPRMTRSDKWRKRPSVVRYFEYKDQLNKEIRGSLEPVFTVTFHMPMPKSWSKRKCESYNGKPHQVKPDADNLLKALQDALCDDDSYIYDVRVRKFWSYTGKIEIEEYERN